MHRGRKWQKRSHERGSGSPGGPSAFERNNEKRPDLLVFGYASRIFHDDTKARFFEEGRHLIPWMGDTNLRIDRYDCRGHLHNLQSVDGNRLADGSIVGTELYGDADFEALSDEERYRDLWNLEKEQSAREKALLESEMEEDYLAATGDSPEHSPPPAAKFGAVPFSYAEKMTDVVEKDEINVQLDSQTAATTVGSEISMAPASQSPTVLNSEEVDIPFVPRADFHIPAHICLPQFDKINSIIEKTAQFIAEKGPQLEMVIRTKQSANGNFGFLNPKDVLRPYYNFLVDALKSGSYVPAPVKEVPSRPSTPPPPPESDSDSDYGDYLHPSLMKAHIAPPKPVAAVAPIFSTSSPTSNLYLSLIQTVKEANSRPLGVSFSTGPSPEVLAAIDKIVTYIVKNGESFEELIQKRHGPDDPKFGFVHGYHPYHSLYEEKKKSALAAAFRPKFTGFSYKPRNRKSFFQRMKDMTVGDTPAEKQTEPSFAKSLDRLPSPTAPLVPPPPPPPPSVPQTVEDPRITELKKKAMEASMRIAEKLKERANLPAKVEPITVSVATLKLNSALSEPDTPKEVCKTVITTKPVEVPVKPAYADPGSLLELLQLDQSSAGKDVALNSNKKRRRERSTSRSSTDSRGARQGKKPRHRRHSRSRSPSTRRKHRRNHHR